MDFLKAESLPWLAGPIAQLREAAGADRLPHSLLVLAAPGVGGDRLAAWAMAFALCDRGGPGDRGRPCGTCASCLLLLADNHPDAHVVRREEDAQQIKIDQVRELIETLSQKSYRGGYKVGWIENAEALNVNGANAFLKTLEEPTSRTLLILTATRAHRLPATILSRCLRLALRAPDSDSARAWLVAEAGPGDWDAALALAGGAPLLAAEFRDGGLGELDRDMREAVAQLAAQAVDVTLLAERWTRGDPVMRVAWLENWITGRIVAALGGPGSVQTAEPVRLPGALLKAKIRSLYALLDAAREFKRLASTGLNQQLALEALLLRCRGALS
ncbi:MAG: hypothetical protein KGL92_09870 [Gammaproteobacteria bacterium]|nr:hypothetical protein [Gammaproteobacteria bacterium]